MNTFNRVLFIIICSFIYSITGFAQHALFQPLGDLPGGIFDSGASAVSADGSVVVGYGTTAQGQQAFRWTQSTGMTSLGNLPDSTLKINWAYDISADGSVIVGSGDTGAVRSFGEGERGFRWTKESGMAAIGNLDGLSFNTAWGTSTNGAVVVGDGGKQAFRWTQNNGMMGLGVLSSQLKSRAIAVSDDGNVVTGSCWSVENGPEEAFRWTPEGGMQGLGYLSNGPYGTFSFPNAISPDGSVIAGSSSSPSGEAPFRWTQNTGMINLGHLPGKTTTHPSGVSAFGKIIVGGSFTNPTDGEAFIWDSTNGMRNLKTVLQTIYGLNLTGWILHSAGGISADGNVIVGSGTNPSGQSEAFRVVLDTVPKKYKIIDLGTLGGTSSWAFGMNNNGQVVGSSFPRGTTTTINPYLYSNGRMTNLNTNGGWATGINDSGQVVGTAVIGSNSHAFTYSNGHTTDLGTLGGIYSEGWAINKNGLAVGWAEFSRNSYSHHAVLYNHGVNTDLGTLGGTRSMANSINDLGVIVGESRMNGDSTSHAFLYSNQQIIDLGTLGGSNSSAACINANEQIAGSADIASGNSHAFLYNNGLMTDLGTLGGVSSSASGINDYGQVVGSAGINDTVGHAFIYSDGRMTDLNTLIDPALSWVLSWAISINNKGQIAGNGMINGHAHAFLMTPDTAGPAGIHEIKKNEINKFFKLEQNYPNPFNPTTTIQYTLIQSSRVKLIAYNILGQRIKTITDSFQNAGEYSIVWDGTDESNIPVSSGVYFYRLETGGSSMQRKMLLLR
jgi:probable HAF family extracellular repeat protein